MQWGWDIGVGGGGGGLYSILVFIWNKADANDAEMKKKLRKISTLRLAIGSVADPHPAFHLNADPDPK